MSTDNVAVVAPSDGLAFAEIEQVTEDLQLYQDAREMFLVSANNMIELLGKWIAPHDAGHLPEVPADVRQAAQAIIRERYRILAGLQARTPSERGTA
jgi:hypothetical protein